MELPTHHPTPRDLAACAYVDFSPTAEFDAVITHLNRA
jgi:hypothetical protein